MASNNLRQTLVTQARKMSTKINFWGPETGRWGGGSSTRRGGGPKVHALPRKFVFLGFRREESGMSREFSRDVPHAWGCFKSEKRKKHINMMKRSEHPPFRTPP